jgi:Ca2+-binding RTX toxin-like protein
VVDPALTLPALLDGGPGNDRLAAGGGPSILVGGDGNDTLAGGPGRCLLIGGAGADVLLGGAGQAVLVGGTTDYDGDAAALWGLLREWSPPDLGYAARVSHLLQGGGLNGAAVLSAATAHDDGARDQLLGGWDLDLDFVGAGNLLGQKPGDTAVPV